MGISLTGLKTIEVLSDALKDMPKVANAAMADAINKTSTFARKEGVSAIVNDTTLKEPYVRSKIRPGKRAKYDSLRATVDAEQRDVLAGRYAHRATSEGVKLKIKAKGGYRQIKGAWITGALKGSGATTGIGVTFKAALSIMEKGLGKGKGATPGKAKKIASIKRSAAKNKRGWSGMYVLHSRSINQQFESVAEDIKPLVYRKLSVEFIDIFQRKMG